MVNVYIGYDSKQIKAYDVCTKSILNYNSNVNIIPLKKELLNVEDSLASTEFTYTRFLVPYLNNYKGWALYIDCDIVATIDIQSLFDLADEKYGLMCVKHDYKPIDTVKMDSKSQSIYPRKNWSSVMLWNCGYRYNKTLTKEFIETRSASYLHRMMWLKDNEIGSLDHTWNYLVGWYKTGNPKLIHYTEGGPWLDKYKDCEYSEEWFKFYD